MLKKSIDIQSHIHITNNSLKLNLSKSNINYLFNLLDINSI